mgnify:CR=1 FL=1
MSEPLSKLKLQLIQAILRTDDPEVLRTALQVLSLENPAATTASADRPMSLDNLPDREAEVQDLQRDIDEVFNA